MKVLLNKRLILGFPDDIAHNKLQVVIVIIYFTQKCVKHIKEIIARLTITNFTDVFAIGDFIIDNFTNKTAFSKFDGN